MSGWHWGTPAGSPGYRNEREEQMIVTEQRATKAAPEEIVGSMLIKSTAQPTINLLLELDLGLISATPDSVSYNTDNFIGDVTYVLESKRNSPSPIEVDIYFLESFVVLYQASQAPDGGEGEGGALGTGAFGEGARRGSAGFESSFYKDRRKENKQREEVFEALRKAQQRHKENPDRDNGTQTGYDFDREDQSLRDKAFDKFEDPRYTPEQEQELHINDGPFPDREEEKQFNNVRDLQDSKRAEFKQELKEEKLEEKLEAEPRSKFVKDAEGHFIKREDRP
jgi:hypothetical protein